MFYDDKEVEIYDRNSFKKRSSSSDMFFLHSYNQWLIPSVSQGANVFSFLLEKFQNIYLTINKKFTSTVNSMCDIAVLLYILQFVRISIYFTPMDGLSLS